MASSLYDTQTAYIDYVIAFVQFQSTLSYLKDPPASYRLPAVDMMKELSTIKHGIVSGWYVLLSSENLAENDPATLCRMPKLLPSTAIVGW